MNESPAKPAPAPAGADGGAASRSGLLYAAVATALFSTSPVFIRWAAPLSPVEVTFWRMTVATLTVLLLARLRGEAIRITIRDLPRFSLFGLVAALHFLFYIASLSFTTVAHSLSLVYTAPVFVTILAAVVLHEPVARRKYAGIVVAVLGVAVLTGFEPAMDGRMIVGDVLAVGSAVCFGLYSVAGRSQRERYPLLSYAAGVYGMAAVWLMPAAAMSWTGAYSLPAVLSIVALGVLPLGIGHTLYNAALRRMHPTIANLVATQEVTGGVLLGALLLGEIPGASALAGAGITLLGIVLVLL